MNHPTPAIVAQSAVRPLPRWALLLLCLALPLVSMPAHAQDALLDPQKRLAGWLKEVEEEHMAL